MDRPERFEFVCWVSGADITPERMKVAWKAFKKDKSILPPGVHTFPSDVQGVRTLAVGKSIIFDARPYRYGFVFYAYHRDEERRAKIVPTLQSNITWCYKIGLTGDDLRTHVDLRSWVDAIKDARDEAMRTKEAAQDQSIVLHEALAKSNEALAKAHDEIVRLREENAQLRQEMRDFMREAQRRQDEMQAKLLEMQAKLSRYEQLYGPLP